MKRKIESRNYEKLRGRRQGRREGRKRKRNKEQAGSFIVRIPIRAT